MSEIATVRDPITGHLLPGAKLPGGGNPIAKLQYQNRMRFLSAVTPEELDKAREQLVTDMYDVSPKVRQAARAQFYDIVYGKGTQTHEITRGDDSSSRSEVESKMGRILDALQDQPEARERVAGILLGGGQLPDVIATVVTTEGVADGRID
jgi:hypothetical protein